MAVSVVGDGALEFDAVIHGSQFKKQFDEIERSLKGLTNTAKKEGAEIDSLVKKVTGALAAYASFTTATNFVQDIVRVRGEFQQLEVAFSTMLGSKERADKLMAEAIQLAAITPFSLQDVASGAKQLLAYGFAAEETTKNLTTLGNIAAGVSAPLNDIVYLYGTLRAQGRAYAVDIRQFASRGIPIYEQLAEVLGVAQEEVIGLVEAGKVGFPEVEKAFQNLTSEGGKFFNLMEEQSKTLTGLLARLGDAWQVMLNDIGQSNEGVFADAIKGAISLVENYQTVLDILKVLVITFGAYKAAIIATTAVQAIATEAVKGYTVAETLRMRAMLISERVMKVLNATMLTNPFVAVAAGIAALVSALVIFNRETDRTVSATEALARAQDTLKEKYDEQEASLRSLVVQLKNANGNHTEEVRLLREIGKIDSKIIQGIDQKAINYDKLTDNVTNYINALREQFKIEANEEAIKASIQREQVLEEQLRAEEERSKRRKRIADEQRSSTPIPGTVSSSLTFDQKKEDAYLNTLRGQLDSQKKITEELGKSSAIAKKSEVKQEVVETVKVLEDQLDSLKEEQKNVSTSSSKWKEYQKQIDAVQKKIESITGKNASKELKKTLDEREAALKSFREELNRAEIELRRSGLTAEQAELDRINETYDELRKKSIELGLGKDAAVQKRIENLRSAEITNANAKVELDKYQQQLEEQRKIFEQYEEAKKEFGIETANKMFAEQTKGFDSFLDFLDDESAKLFALRGTKESQLKLNAVSVEVVNEEKRTNEQRVQAERNRLKEVLDLTQTSTAEKLKLEEQYQSDFQLLQSNYKGEDLRERLQLLKENLNTQLAEVDRNARLQAGIFKKLAEDITFYSREQLKARVKDLKEQLISNADLSPVIKQAIQQDIDNMEGLLANTSELGTTASEISVAMNQIGSAFGSLADSLKDINEGLSDTLQTLSDISSVGANAASAIAQFASGNIVGGIASTIETIAGVFRIASKVRESERRAAEEMQQFQFNILAGEIDINAQYRERERQQAKINELRLKGLEDEQRILERQRKDVEDQYNLILKQLQNEQFIVEKTTEKYGGFLGIGRKTRTVEVLESLAGKSFEELERLFEMGQLTENAQKYFEALRSLREEMAETDQGIVENAKELREALTGTTSDAITDSIVEGLRNGDRAAEAFADNFEELMRNAALNSIKFQLLEPAIEQFHKDFAAFAESGGVLDQEEKDKLNEAWQTMVSIAADRAKQLEDIMGISLDSMDDQSARASAIKGIRQDQADLIAGRLGGIQSSAVQLYRIAQQKLAVLNRIESNTSRLIQMQKDISEMQTRGIKLR